MNAIFYVLPLIFGVLGWSMNHMEMYAFGGALSFYTAYTIINEATTSPNTLTNSDVFISIIYLLLAVSLMLRIAIRPKEVE
jgi:hypothetical protein